MCRDPPLLQTVAAHGAPPTFRNEGGSSLAAMQAPGGDILNGVVIDSVMLPWRSGWLRADALAGYAAALAGAPFVFPAQPRVCTRGYDMSLPAEAEGGEGGAVPLTGSGSATIWRFLRRLRDPFVFPASRRDADVEWLGHG